MSRTACSPAGRNIACLLRHDNADRRLTPLGRRVGLVTDDAWDRLQRKEQPSRS